MLKSIYCLSQGDWSNSSTQWTFVKLQSHDAIYWLRFYSSSLIHILSLSNSHNNVASIQTNWGDKSHRVIIALGSNQGQGKVEGFDSVERIFFLLFNVGISLFT